MPLCVLSNRSLCTLVTTCCVLCGGMCGMCMCAGACVALHWMVLLTPSLHTTYHSYTKTCTLSPYILLPRAPLFRECLSPSGTGGVLMSTPCLINVLHSITQKHTNLLYPWRLKASKLVQSETIDGSHMPLAGFTFCHLVMDASFESVTVFVAMLL